MDVRGRGSGGGGPGSWKSCQARSYREVHGRVLISSGRSPRLSAEVACRLAAIIKDDGGGGASQMPSWSQIRLEVE